MSNVVVVDANIAIKWVINEANSSTALSMLKGWTDTGVMILAPALLVYEITNILHRHVLRGTLTSEDAKQGLNEVIFPVLEFDFAESPAFSIRAMKLAERFNLPAAYDAHYLALAEFEGCELWTDDSRMWRAVKDQLDWVCCLNDYHPA